MCVKYNRSTRIPSTPVDCTVSLPPNTASSPRSLYHATGSGNTLGLSPSPLIASRNKCSNVADDSTLGVSFSTPHNSLKKFRILVCEYSPPKFLPLFSTSPLPSHGETSTVGTRTPRRSNANVISAPSCAVSVYVTASPGGTPTGGATWSPKPPCSSKVRMKSVVFHCGEVRTAS